MASEGLSAVMDSQVESDSEAGSTCCHSRTDTPKSGVGALIAGILIGGQGMIWGLTINITQPPLFSTAYWVLHGILAGSAVLVACLLGRPLLFALAESVRERRIGIEALFTLTATGAMAASLIASITGKGSVYYEVVAIVLAIYSLGKFVGRRTREQMLKEVEQVETDFSQCFVKRCCGNRMTVAVGDLDETSRVSVEAGEPITVSGTISEGSGVLRTALLTGEKNWVDATEGDRVEAGYWLVSGDISVVPDPIQNGRMLDGVFASLKEARKHPSHIEAEAHRLAAYFVPFVIGVAVFTAAFWLWRDSWVTAHFNAMSVLLVACPCALGLATPIAVWRGLLSLASLGVVSRDARLIDGLASTHRIFWDKTGTLTDFDDLGIDLILDEQAPIDRSTLIRWLSSLETQSDHPVAQAIVRKFGKPEQPVVFDQVTLIPGGISGNLASKQRFDVIDATQVGDSESVDSKQLALLIDGKPVGRLVMRERLRPDVEALIQGLADDGIESSVITGDPRPQVSLAESGVTMQYGMTPQQKADEIDRSVQRGERPVLIGDGINDTPAMNAAIASLAIGSGTHLARVFASGIIQDESLPKLMKAIENSRQTLACIRGNIRFSLIYNVVGMGLAASGNLHPVVAALLMLGSSLWVSWRAAKQMS